MAQDLRDLFKKCREFQKADMKKGHEARFLARLEGELPERKRKFYWMRIAASLLVVAGVATLFAKWYQTPEDTNNQVVDGVQQVQKSSISLGDLSPDLKKVETYYLTNINLELTQLQVNAENTELVNGYLQRLSELNDEYLILNGELNQMGPNDQTISAQIKNLQLRLQLLYKLKEKLNEIKSAKNDEVESLSI